jgi:hypothetical protein
MKANGRLRRTLALLATICGAVCTQAMVDGGMRDAEWFAGVESKLLVLEFENPLGDAHGQQLTELTGRMALASVNGLRGFAVITLRQDNPPRTLTAEVVGSLAGRQQAPVVIWGEFYERKGKVFVTPHLRYIPDIGRDRLRITSDLGIHGITDPTSAVGSLPTDQVNFAPIELSKQSLLDLEELWSRTVVLREEPAADAPLSGELTRNRPYYVIDRKEGWTRLRVREGGEGWAPLTALSQHDEFKELTGVTLFAGGMLQLLIGNHEAARATFTEYLETYATHQDVMNRALAHTLLGYAHHLNRSLDPRERYDRSARQFQAAAELLPDAASPVNGLAVALFDKAAATSVDPAGVRQLEQQLVHVIRTENDVEAVRNLQALYQLPQASAYFSGSTSDFPSARSERIGLLKTLEQKFAP